MRIFTTTPRSRDKAIVSFFYGPAFERAERLMQHRPLSDETNPLSFNDLLEDCDLNESFLGQMAWILLGDGLCRTKRDRFGPFWKTMRVWAPAIERKRVHP